jgi:hypothetical protein
MRTDPIPVIVGEIKRESVVPDKIVISSPTIEDIRIPFVPEKAIVILPAGIIMDKAELVLARLPIENDFTDVYQNTTLVLSGIPKEDLTTVQLPEVDLKSPKTPSINPAELFDIIKGGILFSSRNSILKISTFFTELFICMLFLDPTKTLSSGKV